MLLAPLAALLLAASGGPARPSVTVLSYTHSTTAGQNVVAVASVAGPATACTGTLSHGSSASRQTVHVTRHRVSLRWPTTPSGSTSMAVLTIACPGSGSARVRVTLTASNVQARVVVGKSGFTFSTDDGTINYGAVLTNPSPNQDALNVQMTANFLSAGGQIVASDVFTLPDVPAGATVYYGGFSPFSALGPSPRTMQLTPLVGDHQPAVHLPVVRVTNLQAAPDDFLSTAIQGQFSNPYSKTLSVLTAITYVVFGKGGNVISGGLTFPNADVPQAGQFGFQDYDESLTAASVGSIRASVSPSFG